MRETQIMQAQIILASGQAIVANVDKVDIVKDSHGRIVDMRWTTPPDAYAELRYLDPRQVAAVVMIHDMPGQTPISR